MSIEVTALGWVHSEPKLIQGKKEPFVRFDIISHRGHFKDHVGLEGPSPLKRPCFDVLTVEFYGMYSKDIIGRISKGDLIHVNGALISRIFNNNKGIVIKHAILICRNYLCYNHKWNSTTYIPSDMNYLKDISRNDTSLDQYKKLNPTVVERKK